MGKVNNVISVGTLHCSISFRKGHRKHCRKIQTQVRPGPEHDGIWKRERQWNSVQLCLFMNIQRLIQNGHHGLLARHGHCCGGAFLFLSIQKPESFLAVQQECSLGCSTGDVCEAHKRKPAKAIYILLYFQRSVVFSLWLWKFLLRDMGKNIPAKEKASTHFQLWPS